MEKTNPNKMEDEDIISFLKADMDSAQQIQDELAGQRESYYKAFRSNLYGNERAGWSQSVAPLIWSNHQSNLSALTEIFSDEFFSLKSTNEDRADKFQRLIRYQMFRKQDGYRKLYDFLYEAGLYHYAIFKVYYHEEFDLVYDKYGRMDGKGVMQLAMQPDTTVTKYDELTMPFGTLYENVKTAKKVFSYRGPKFEVLPPWELKYSPDCKISDWGSIEGRLVYHEVKRSMDYIRKKEKIGAYRKGTYKKCLDLGAQPNTVSKTDEATILYNADDLTEHDSTAQTDDVLNKELTIKECYVRMDTDDDGLLEPCIVIVIEDSIVAQVEDNPYGRPPFRIGGMLPEPHKIRCIAPPEVLENDQKVMTNLLRFIQDSAAMSTYRNPVTPDVRMQQMLQARKPFDVILGDPAKIGEVPVQPPDQFILKAWELMKGNNEETTGNTRYNQGQDAQSLNKTAYGISLISQASARRLRMSAKLIGNGPMTGLIRDFIFINQKWRSWDSIPLLGTDIVVNKNDLDGEYDIEVDIGVSPAEKQQTANQVDLLMQWQTQIGLNMGLTDPVKHMKTVKKKYGLLNMNIDQYLFTEQEVMRNMEEAKKQPPKEDWKEYVAMDKLFPLLSPSEKAQIIQRLGIQPDMKWHQENDLIDVKAAMMEGRMDLEGKKEIEKIKAQRELAGKQIDAGTKKQVEAIKTQNNEKQHTRDMQKEMLKFAIKRDDDRRRETANKGNGSTGVQKIPEG
jgi:hypothetical protein